MQVMFHFAISFVCCAMYTDNGYLLTKMTHPKQKIFDSSAKFDRNCYKNVDKSYHIYNIFVAKIYFCT